MSMDATATVPERRTSDYEHYDLLAMKRPDGSYYVHHPTEPEPTRFSEFAGVMVRIQGYEPKMFPPALGDCVRLDLRGLSDLERHAVEGAVKERQGKGLAGEVIADLSRPSDFLF